MNRFLWLLCLLALLLPGWSVNAGGDALHVLRKDGSPSELRNRSSYVTVQPAH